MSSYKTSIVQGIQEAVENAAGQLSCTHHGKKPKVKILGKDLDNIQLEISGCCDEFI